jgi:hypothetical protein
MTSINLPQKQMPASTQSPQTPAYGSQVVAQARALRQILQHKADAGAADAVEKQQTAKARAGQAKTTGAQARSTTPALSATVLRGIATNAALGPVLPPLTQAADTTPVKVQAAAQKMSFFASAATSSAWNAPATMLTGGNFNWSLFAFLLNEARWKRADKILSLTQELSAITLDVQNTSAATSILVTKGQVMADRFEAVMDVLRSVTTLRDEWRKSRLGNIAEFYPNPGQDIDLVKPLPPYIPHLGDALRADFIGALGGHAQTGFYDSAGNPTPHYYKNKFDLSADERARLRRINAAVVCTPTSGLMVHSVSGKPLERTLLTDSEVQELAQRDARDGTHYAERYKKHINEMFAARGEDLPEQFGLYDYEAKILHSEADNARTAGRLDLAAAAEARAHEMDKKANIFFNRLNVQMAEVGTAHTTMGDLMFQMKWLGENIKALEEEDKKLNVEVRNPGNDARSLNKATRDQIKQNMLRKTVVLNRLIAVYQGGPVNQFGVNALSTLQAKRAAVMAEPDSPLRTQALSHLDRQIDPLVAQRDAASSRIDGRSRRTDTGASQAAFDANLTVLEDRNATPELRRRASRWQAEFMATALPHNWQACVLTHWLEKNPDATAAQIATQVQALPALSMGVMQRHLQRACEMAKQAKQAASEIDASDSPAARAAKEAELVRACEGLDAQARQQAKKCSDPQLWGGRPTQIGNPVLRSIKERYVTPAYAPRAGIGKLRTNVANGVALPESLQPSTLPVEALSATQFKTKTAYTENADSFPTDFTDKKAAEAYYADAARAGAAAHAGMHFGIPNQLKNIPLIGRFMPQQEWFNETNAVRVAQQVTDRFYQGVHDADNTLTGYPEMFADQTVDATSNTLSEAMSAFSQAAEQIKGMVEQIQQVVNRPLTWP